MWSWVLVRSASPWLDTWRREATAWEPRAEAGRADLPQGVEVIAANVAEASEAKRACDGATVVYHCANPPYARWPELHPPLMKAIIEGAASAGAKLIFGDNLYAYGPWIVPSPRICPTRPGAPTGEPGPASPTIAWRRIRMAGSGRPSGGDRTSSDRMPTNQPWATGCSPAPWRTSRPGC
jgi:hypothetical protein